MNGLDHGVLNVPLSKRGNIDAQIDAYKREQAAQAKTAAKQKATETRVLRERAKAIVRALPCDRLEGFATKLGATTTQARNKLLSEAHWNPTAIIRVFGTDGPVGGAL